MASKKTKGPQLSVDVRTEKSFSYDITEADIIDLITASIPENIKKFNPTITLHGSDWHDVSATISYKEITNERIPLVVPS